VGTYRLWAGSFTGLLCRYNGDLPGFYRAARKLSEQPGRERRERLERLRLAADCLAHD
jgi:predicted aminopeptidase